MGPKVGERRASADWPLGLFVVLVICGSLIVAYSTGFDIVDDHLFLLSLASGRTLFGVNILLTHGRFAPVNGAAYNALLLIMPRVTSVALHASNALEFLLFSFILLRLLKLEVSRNAAICGAAVFLLQPSFVTAVNRLLVPERTACLAIVTMLYCYRRASGKIGWLLCLLAANVAIYSKEPIAGAVLVFACCQIFLRKFGEQTKTGDGTRSLDLALAASAIGFFVLYKLLTGSSHSVSYASARRFLPFFANVAQNIRGYSLFSDPFLFFVALPLSVCRFWGNLRRPSTWRGSTDAALFAGVAYMFATLVLNLSYTVYYLLPATCLVWPSVCRQAAEILKWSDLRQWVVCGTVLVAALALPTQVAGRFVIPVALFATGAVMVFGRPELRRRMGAYGLAFAGLTFGLNTVWGSVNSTIDLKFRPVAYNQIVDQLALNIRRSGLPGRKNVFITGMTAEAGVEAFTSLDANLRFRGLTSADFDLLSSTPPDGFFEPQPESAYTVFRDPSPRIPQKGDLVITPPGLPPPRASMLVAAFELRTPLNLGLDRNIQLVKGRILGRPDPFGKPRLFRLSVSM